MRNQAGRGVTPQRKMINNTGKFNNAGIRKQQGTTRVIYDTLPLDGQTVLRFFEGSNNRDFPFTNTGADGNKLGVGSALAIERAYFTILVIVDDVVSLVTTLDTFSGDVQVGEMNIEIANSQVLKQVPLLSFDPRFNKNAYHDAYNNFEFDTQLIINPLLEFVFPVRLNPYLAVASTYLRLSVEGTGAIISPRTTM